MVETTISILQTPYKVELDDTKLLDDKVARIRFEDLHQAVKFMTNISDYSFPIGKQWYTVNHIFCGGRDVAVTLKINRPEYIH
ncbi:hypothetical protein [Ligilactobacillus acidipiscis]|uniref:hypothetical protein n=1 Tax=Ligilactobacillus acidipiscis TaxID=89059 RepID=UPI0023F7300C|nr:hypothetical protein [Ligilactobacillus acidipiscis]WEV57841.1 hypothetical protein OZX66_04700 [Ligilactobacillus acidipiscis]